MLLKELIAMNEANDLPSLKELGAFIEDRGSHLFVVDGYHVNDLGLVVSGEFGDERPFDMQLSYEGSKLSVDFNVADDADGDPDDQHFGFDVNAGSTEEMLKAIEERLREAAEEFELHDD